MVDDTTDSELDFEQKAIALLPSVREHLVNTMASALRTRLDVTDVLQETYIRAIQAQDTFQYRGDAQMGAWLKRIARNVVLSAIRSAGRESSFPQSDTWGAFAEKLHESGALTPSEEFSEKEHRQLVALAIASLPEHYQQVLKLRYDAGLKLVDVARELGMTPAAVRGLHRNALQSLQEKVSRFSISFSGG